jgi:mRNA interferase RelE/StbE
MSYRVVIPKSVQKQLTQLPRDLRNRVLDRISSLAENPRPSGTKKLKGYQNEYRIRIGDYRIRYEIDEGESVVIILNCRHRKDAYRD